MTQERSGLLDEEGDDDEDEEKPEEPVLHLVISADRSAFTLSAKYNSPLYTGDDARPQSLGTAHTDPADQ